MSSDISGETLKQANQLYWDSDLSVNRIADELELSKGALYGIVEPLPAGTGCPRCGSEVVFENRTARDKGRLACAECEWDGESSETIGLDEDDADYGAVVLESLGEEADPPAQDDAGDGEEETVSPSETRYAPPPHRSSMSSIAGGALIGAAVGLALVLWARRK